MDAADLINAAESVLGEFTLANQHFRAGYVASALVSTSGALCTGISIDVACGIGFCAEHAAIAELLKNRETEINMIVAVSEAGVLPPCGRCREFMFQINHGNVNTKVVVSDDEIVTLDALLPRRWLEGDPPHAGGNPCAS